MATFRERGPYQWQAQVRKKGHACQTKTFETRAAAEQWVREIEYEIDRGIFASRAEAETTTLRELNERYREGVTPLKKGAAPESARINALLRYMLSARIVASLRGIEIARYRDERLKKVTPATVKRDLVVFSHLFEVARKEWGIHVHNPVRDIKLPPNSRARDHRLQVGNDGAPSEERRLLGACLEARNPYLLPIVRLALESAMRQRELDGSSNYHWPQRSAHAAAIHASEGGRAGEKARLAG